jgi:predicted metal-dependent phosphotriesterase family hydrolase
MSEEAMAAQIRDDICGGADGTDIRCGIIGEIGCSWPLTGTCVIRNQQKNIFSAAFTDVDLEY